MGVCVQRVVFRTQQVAVGRLARFVRRSRRGPNRIDEFLCPLRKVLLCINNHGGKLAPSRWATFGGLDDCPIVQKIQNGPAYTLNGPFDCDRDFVPRCPACPAAPD